MLTFRVYGVALPKGNMKPFLAKGMKFPIVTESNRNVKSWQQLIAEGASHALQALPEADRALLLYGVRVSVAFFLPRPQAFKKRGVFVPHIKAPDVDKLARAVLDALSAVTYCDDRQVTELIAGKYYAEVAGPAYVDVRVEQAPAPTSEATIPTYERRALPLFEVIQ
jgi:Holliday junction resolvase RusA-like endonuclease